MNHLKVLANGTWLGTLEVTARRWSFQYAPAWNEYPLAPGFPLAVREYHDTEKTRHVEWFFENLLPEGRLRELIAQRDRIDPRDTWAFLLKHGHDTAGALSLVTSYNEPKHNKPIDNEPPSLAEKLRPLSPEDLANTIKISRQRNLPLIAAWDDLRMSLAGAQEKMALYFDETGNMFIPEGGSASTHIIKPDNASSDFPFCPANEFFCMRLAQDLRIPVPSVDLLHLPEPIYVIERFDRIRQVTQGKSPSIVRLHQMDFCQALGVSARQKYESDGGLGLNDLFAFLQGPHIYQPIKATHDVLQWIMFNYVVGNLDAHAKNIAFMWVKDKVKPAPFYDLLCVESYLPRATMAMSIAGENKAGWVEGIHWDALAYEAKVSPQYVRTTLSRLDAELTSALSRTLTDTRIIKEERAFIEEKVLPVISERRSFLADALRSPLCSFAEVTRSPLLSPDVIDRLQKRARQETRKAST